MTTTSGYSGTPLHRKLGIKPGHRLLLQRAPGGFDLGALPEVTISRRPGRAPYDVILAFTPDRATLERTFAPLVEKLERAGGLWIAWPKKSSGMPTDLNENVVRDVGLATGLVDNKVCAVTDVWSGLRFVRRLRDRD